MPNNITINAPALPPFFVDKNNEPKLEDVPGKSFWISTYNAGGTVFISFNNDDDNAASVVDNGYPFLNPLSGVSLMVTCSNLNRIKIVFPSSLGSVRIMKAKVDSG